MQHGCDSAGFGYLLLAIGYSSTWPRPTEPATDPFRVAWPLVAIDLLMTSYGLTLAPNCFSALECYRALLLAGMVAWSLRQFDYSSGQFWQFLNLSFCTLVESVQSRKDTRDHRMIVFQISDVPDAETCLKCAMCELAV